MGMFDSVLVGCPKCGAEIEFQSKSGVCEMKRYYYSSVPTAVAEDLSGESADCPKCGKHVSIHALDIPTRVIMHVVNDQLEESAE